MTTFSPLVLFPPHWILPWVAVAGLAAAILGARRLAFAAGILVIGDLGSWFLPALRLGAVPVWIPWLLGVLMWLMILHGVIGTLFGKDVAVHVTGTYLTRILDALLVGPLRLVIRMLRRHGPGG